MKQLITRTITGTILVALTIGSIFLDPFVFAGIFLVFCVLGFRELYGLFNPAEVQVQKITGVIAGVITYISVVLVALETIKTGWLLLLIPVILLPFIFELYRKKANPFLNIAVTLLPVFYIAIPFAILNFLLIGGPQGNEHVPEIILGFFIIIWCGDIMAYLGGSAFGKHLLFERISPKKSWEGSITGGVFSLGAAWVLSLFFNELSTPEWLGMAAVIIVAGTFGDLVESMLKRSAQAKDSGKLLPGHGGILDRFDCILIAAPFVFLYLYLINHYL